MERVGYGVRKDEVQSHVRNKEFPGIPGLLKVTDVYRGYRL